MTFNCQAVSNSAEFMLLAPVKGSKSEDMQLIVIKIELRTQFFFKNVPILIRRVRGKIKSKMSLIKMSLFMVGG